MAVGPIVWVLGGWARRFRLAPTPPYLQCACYCLSFSPGFRRKPNLRRFHSQKGNMKATSRGNCPSWVTRFVWLWVSAERVHGEAVVFPVVSLEASSQWRTRLGMGSVLAPDVNLPQMWTCPRCEPGWSGSTCMSSCSGKFGLAQGTWSSTKGCFGNEQALFWKEDIWCLERQRVPSSLHGTCTFKGRIATLLSAEQKAQRCAPSHHPKSTCTDPNPLVLGSQSTSPSITGDSFRKSSWKNRACCTEIVRSLWVREWIPRLQETLKRC